MPYGKAGETRAFGSPGRYIQGPGAWERLAEYAKDYGDKTFILIDPFFAGELSKRFEEQFEALGQAVSCLAFGGECSQEEIDRVCALAEGENFSLFIGVGGGKTCDTLKAVAVHHNKPMFICPTTASTDAATSASAMVYGPGGQSVNRKLYRNPDWVIVDTEVIIKAPVRMLTAGFGDGLATYIEARACVKTGNVNSVHDCSSRHTLAGAAIAKLAYDTIMEKGISALNAAKNQIRTEDFEDVVEANTLLSGLGCENTSCSIAHGLHVALHTLEDTRGMMHGETVAFAALVQIYAEKRPAEEFQRLYAFYKKVGLPTTLAEIGIKTDKKEKLEKVITESLQKDLSLLKIQPWKVTVPQLVNAVLYVDLYGKLEKDCPQFIKETEK